MSYSKLYSSIVHSSLWTEPDHIRLLFITLLAIADREGYVYGSRNGLLRLANVNLGQCAEDDPFEALMKPDEDSSDQLRNPENEGRRIEQVPGGFRILNFAYYRGLRNEDDRREQNKEAQRRHRYRQQSQQVSEMSAKVSQHKPISEAAQEAETEATAHADAHAAKEEKNKKRVDFFSSSSNDQRPITKYGYPLPPRCTIRASDGAVLDYTGRVMDVNQVRNALAAVGIATSSIPLP